MATQGVGGPLVDVDRAPCPVTGLEGPEAQALLTVAGVLLADVDGGCGLAVEDPVEQAVAPAHPEHLASAFPGHQGGAPHHVVWVVGRVVEEACTRQLGCPIGPARARLHYGASATEFGYPADGLGRGNRIGIRRLQDRLGEGEPPASVRVATVHHTATLVLRH
jgi:hypothetical protein